LPLPQQPGVPAFSPVNTAGLTWPQSTPHVSLAPGTWTDSAWLLATLASLGFDQVAEIVSV
jgi:hypothetical protein